MCKYYYASYANRVKRNLSQLPSWLQRELCNSTVTNIKWMIAEMPKGPGLLSQCGKFLLLYAAILSLHTFCLFPGLSALVEKATQLKEIVHTKR